MKVIPPVDIGPARLLASSASELHTPAEYDAAVSYGYGAMVAVAADYKRYESLVADNLGNTPKLSADRWAVLGPTETAYNAAVTYPKDATASYNRRVYLSLAAGNTGNAPPIPPVTATEWWLDIGPTNKWAMFDATRNTQTVWPSPLVVTFAPGERINTLGVVGMVANQLQVAATSVNGGGDVYPNAVSESASGVCDLSSRDVVNGYDYCFAPFTIIDSYVIGDMPPMTDIVITLTLSSDSGNVKCGAVIAGTSVFLGAVQYYARADNVNFSTIEQDSYSNVALTPRTAFQKTDQVLRLPAGELNKVMAAKDRLNGKPALWTGLDDSTSDWFQMLRILGVWKEFSFTMENEYRVKITLSLEEI